MKLKIQIYSMKMKIILLMILKIKELILIHLKLLNYYIQEILVKFIKFIIKMIKNII